MFYTAENPRAVQAWSLYRSDFEMSRLNAALKSSCFYCPVPAWMS